MKSSKTPIYPKTEQRISSFGDRLRLARLRRKFSAATVCARAGVSRMTLYRIESGDPNVAFGNYVNVLKVLQLDSDLDALALDDALGRRLQDLQIPVRRRAPKK